MVDIVTSSQTEMEEHTWFVALSKKMAFVDNKHITTATQYALHHHWCRVFIRKETT
jgi:hypothetical protein